MWGSPIRVKSTLKKDELVEHGIELQVILNQLTEQAELAVQQSNPAASFLHATGKLFSSSLR